ncbi:MAG: PVC-type heme-binding CxxCH protein [Akkermansiaceae bacterium]
MSPLFATEPFQLQLRDRVESEEIAGQHRIRLRSEDWKPEETAVIVCDMWDAHHCLNAVRRATQLVPRMNALLEEVRNRGGLIIHAPSSCMAAYADHPARKRAQAVPRSKSPPEGINDWLQWIDEDEKQAGYPIDHSDGGEDDDPKEHAEWARELKEQGRNPRSPWKSQIVSIKIDPKRDMITDSGLENWSILEQRGIRNVLLVGVHTNMCVLGRPFGLRQLKRNGINVSLVRDLTDTMYNPAMPPKVSHFAGTDLVIGHIEKYVCPTVRSSDLLGGKDFVFAKDDRKKIVFLIGEREYKTAETLPAFAEAQLTNQYRCQFLFAENGSNDFGDITSALEDADALFLSVRRRTPKLAHMEAISNFIKAGKPVIGIRTASHAFSLRGKPAPKDHGVWESFDPDVFGGNYHGHHGSKLKTFAKVIGEHAIVEGIARDEFATGGSLYEVLPLKKGATVLLEGRAASIKQAEPVAWTFTNVHGGRSFYTSLGHVDDFDNPVFVTLLKRSIDWALGNKLKKITAVETIPVPGVWEEMAKGQWKELDGEVWYASRVRLPAEWKDRVTLEVESIDNTAEIYLGGEKIGTLGSFPPGYENGLGEQAKLIVPQHLLKPDQELEVAICIYDHGGRGGFKGRAPLLSRGNDAIVLSGDWAFRPGPGGSPSTTGLKVFEAITRTSRSAHETENLPKSPKESLKKIQVPDDLEVDLVLHEPLVAQPLHLSFDERGRLWVVQYRQYPNPAGLKALSRDLVWRVAYDRIPPPPPHAMGSPFRGEDCITIHEDTNGDGIYDSHKVFMDGLNMATSIAHDTEGIWVTNPPYLLFIPDRNHDDIPDGKIEVHLQGFGLEDSHSIANSLTWGPDGWLYGAQGSTVSASITLPDQDPKRDAVKSMGQNIWRYHPERKIYEIFAEGGGNAFGVEIDSKGRVFSGHNGGDTRGFHYLPGAYYRKGWNKHGALTNSHAYGYFPAMKNAPVARFTHQFIIYEENALPEKYRGKLWGVDVLHNNIVLSEIFPDGSTFQTRDIERVVSSEDRWFRPVMITPAPDGSLYIADWYDRQVNHYRNHEGRLDPDHGRIYRIRAKGGPPKKAEDLSKLTPKELVKRLESASRWQRQTALRLLRKTTGEVPSFDDKNLDSFWASTALGHSNFSDSLESQNADTRRWAVRLLAEATSSERLPLKRLLELADTESDAEVVAQIACTAKRIAGPHGLRLAAQLARRDHFANDPHIPLLIWWAFEATAPGNIAELNKILSATDFWGHDIVKKWVTVNLMRRLAAEGTRPALEQCSRLFQLAPDPSSKRLLMTGLNLAFADHPPAELPKSLAFELKKLTGKLPLSLQLRIGTQGAQERAIAALGDNKITADERIELISILGLNDEAVVRSALIDFATRTNSPNLVIACLAALAGRNVDSELRAFVLGKLGSSNLEVRSAALDFLASDRESSLALLQHATTGKVVLSDESGLLREKLRLHQDTEINEMAKKFWDSKPPQDDFEAEITRVKEIIGSGGGVPKKGAGHFKARCAGCHRMFNQGGLIGPDLTSYQRNDRDALLLAIIAPSAEIREGYEHTVARMKSGEVHSGFREEADPERLVIRQPSGQTRVLPRQEIEQLNISRSSMMPPGLLDGLNDKELRDLFAYLRSTTPPF